jgi:hypothetical protein
MAAVSQITGEDAQYRWAHREYALHGSLRLAFHRRLLPWCDAGLSVWSAPWEGNAVLEYRPASGQPVPAEVTQSSFQDIGMVEFRFTPASRRRLQPVLGLGLGVWFIPGLLGLGSDELGPHLDFGPYLRPALEGQFALRLLLTSRIFLGAGVVAVVDPGSSLLQPLEGAAEVDIPTDALVSPGNPVNSLVMGHLGAGFRF